MTKGAVRKPGLMRGGGGGVVVRITCIVLPCCIIILNIFMETIILYVIIKHKGGIPASGATISFVSRTSAV